MDELHKEADTKKTASDWDLKKYIVIAAVTFGTFCCCILFFFFIYRYHGFAQYWQKTMGILQPVSMGTTFEPLPAAEDERREKSQTDGAYSRNDRRAAVSSSDHLFAAVYDDSGIDQKYPQYDGQYSGRAERF